MPNYNDIRKMTDKELNSFLTEIQRSDKRICQKCGEFILDKRTIAVRKEQTSRTLCILCSNCYTDMLEFLGINDVDYDKF